MNILVTGGRGQLGLSLKKVSGEYPRHSFIFTDMPEADITDRDAMNDIISRSGADAIINCAAYTAVDKAEEEPELARKINVDGARILAAVAKHAGIPLIHISTDYVFDGKGSLPYKETDRTNPAGVYGRTKLEGEHAVLESGSEAFIVRTSWLYSEFGNNFVKTMLRLSVTRDEINVVDDQRGTPTYAPDLARALVVLLDTGARTGIYHYSNEGEISWYDLAVETFSVAGKHVRVNPIPTSQYPTPAARPAYSVLDKSKIAAAGISVPFWKDSLEVCMTALENEM